MLITIAVADYVEPPVWAGSLDYTHQSWDFDYDPSYETTGPDLPIAPDGEPNWFNFSGQPQLIAVDFNVPPEFQHLIEFGLVGWMWNYSDQGFTTARRGYYGGMGHTTLTFKVPCKERTKPFTHQLWIQMTYLGNNNGQQNYNIKLSRDDDFNDLLACEPALLELSELNDANNPPGPAGISQWYRITATYNLPADINSIYVRLTAYRYSPELPQHVMGGPSMIDEVDIDSRSISPSFVDKIDFKDYAAIASKVGQNIPAMDMNPDGTINLDDVSILLESWLKEHILY